MRDKRGLGVLKIFSIFLFLRVFFHLPEHNHIFIVLVVYNFGVFVLAGWWQSLTAEYNPNVYPPSYIMQIRSFNRQAFQTIRMVIDFIHEGSVLT